jgi:hypothetical protein
LTSVILLGIALAAPAADDYVVSPTTTEHWAWQKPARSIQPTVQNAAWIRNPIDAFILARLEAAGLQPAPPASPAQLLRRVSFDLVGLPPTPDEIDSFCNDPAPNAWEKVIDRLLASPRYGERWGRHWLDLARFAESNGYEFDEVRPDAWRYRDYVIRSFNADKPYDRFIREQLAGDELYPDDPDALIATGFNLLGPDMTDSSDQAQRRQNTLNDMTDTAGLAFLGLTVGCARCHDHKFEPIPQTDYYRLQAFFSPATFRKDLPVATPPERAAHESATQEYLALTRSTRDAIAQLEEPHRQRLFNAKLAKLSVEAQLAHKTPPAQRTGGQRELVADTARRVAVSEKEIIKALSSDEQDQLKRLQGQLKQLEPRKPTPLPMTPGLQDAKDGAKTYLLERGELRNRSTEMQPGFPIVLLPGHKSSDAAIRRLAASTGRRAALASWIAQPDHPLTARVLVNRLWQHHFGRGIVPTASDFGLRGERPTHPELLGWLATEFVRRGWSIKQMHKLMLVSSTYQQSTLASPQALKHDPDNQLFSRANRLRLEGEIIRDSLLAISGRLNLKMGGPGVFPPIPAEALQGSRGWAISPDPRDHVRRSVYIFARRNLRFPFLESFDLPDSNLSCPKRERSTTAPQSLALLNSMDVIDAAKALAARLQKETGSDQERITRAYRLTLGRPPSPVERQLAAEFLQESPLSELCRALSNVNEFVYLD